LQAFCRYDGLLCQTSVDRAIETFSTLLRCDLSAVSGFALDDVEVMTERVTQTCAFDNESACA